MKARLAMTVLLLAACATDTAPEPPRARTWSTRHPLPVERFEGFAIERDGQVLFVGGITGLFGDIRTANPSTRVDVYDPLRDAWRDGPALPSDAPKHHLTVAKQGSSVYVLSGFDGIIGKGPNEPFVPVARAFVLEGATWRALSPPPLARGGATAQALGGKIYVTGGAPNEGEPPYSQLDVYDIASDAWTVGPPLPTAREHVASCTLDGRFLVVGGWVGPGNVASHAAEWFDPTLNAWERLPDMPTARGGLGAVADAEGCHVIGGEDWSLPLPGTFATHEIFDARARAWRSAPSMLTARHGFGLAVLTETIFAIGGGPAQGNSYTGVVEAFAQLTRTTF